MDSHLDHDLSNLIEGDERAFRDFYDRWEDRIFIWCKKYIKDQQDTEDVMSRVFVKIWQNIPRILAADDPKAYIHSIAIFTCLSFLKSGKPGETPVEDVETFADDLQAYRYRDDMLEAEVYREARKLLYQAMEGLPEKRKEVLRLIIQEDLTPSEVASLLKISPKTVHDHVTAGTRLLCNLLKDKRLHFMIPLTAGVAFFCLKKFAF